MYSTSLELDNYLREEPVRRYVVTVPVTPLAQRSAAIFCSTFSLLYATFCWPLSTDVALKVQQVPATFNK